MKTLQIRHTFFSQLPKIWLIQVIWNAQTKQNTHTRAYTAMNTSPSTGCYWQNWNRWISCTHIIKIHFLLTPHILCVCVFLSHSISLLNIIYIITHNQMAQLKIFCETTIDKMRSRIKRKTRMKIIIIITL